MAILSFIFILLAILVFSFVLVVSGWWDVMRAARLACRGTSGDYELNLSLDYF